MAKKAATKQIKPKTNKPSVKQVVLVVIILLLMVVFTYAWEVTTLRKMSFLMPEDLNARNNYQANPAVWVIDRKPYAADYRGVYTMSTSGYLKRISHDFTLATTDDGYMLSQIHNKVAVQKMTDGQKVFELEKVRQSMLDSQIVYYLSDTKEQFLYRYSIIDHKSKWLAESVEVYCSLGDGLLFLDTQGKLFFLDQKTMVRQHLSDLPQTETTTFFIDGNVAYFQAQNTVWSFDFETQKLKQVFTNGDYTLENVFNGKLYLSNYKMVDGQRYFTMDRYLLDTEVWEDYFQYTIVEDEEPLFSILDERSYILQFSDDCTLVSWPNFHLMY